MTAGVRVGVAEMPFGAIASDSVGGAGGTCVLRGCVPKKLFVYAASFPEEFRDARGFGCVSRAHGIVLLRARSAMQQMSFLLRMSFVFAAVGN